MSNTQFAKSVDGFVSAESKGKGAFNLLAEFAFSVVKDYTGPDHAAHATALKNTIDAEEKLYRNEHPKMTEMPASYRSAKSVVVNAVKHGVALVDDKGNGVGKSELEKLTKDAKGDSGKPEIQKFTSTMATAMAIFSKLDTIEDLNTAYTLVTELATAVVNARSAAISAAAETK